MPLPPDLDENELKIFISEMPEPQIPPDSISMDLLTEEWLEARHGDRHH